MVSPNKKFTILAGPNGAGKTTFVMNIFPEILSGNKFINADHFAQELCPEDVSKVAIQSGKLFLKEVDRLLKGNDSFIVETTLSGKGLLRKIEAARQNGFETRLIFLWISSVGLCDFRVKGRVASGGHNIPFKDIKRRYERGLLNFRSYMDVVDECGVFLADEFPILTFKNSKRLGEEISHQRLYKEFLKSISTS